MKHSFNCSAFFIIFFLFVAKFHHCNGNSYVIPIDNLAQTGAMELTCDKPEESDSEESSYGDIAWLFNGKPVPIDYDGRHSLLNDRFEALSRLRITHLRFFDTGLYSCKRGQKLGKPYYAFIPRDDFQLAVPEMAQMEFNCPFLWLKNLSGVWSVSAKWKLNGTTQSFLETFQRDERLTIIANKSTEGVWTCEVVINRREPSSIYLQNFSIAIAPPLAEFDKFVDLDLIYMAVPFVLAILLASCILYALASVTILQHFTNKPEYQAPQLTDDDFRALIRDQLSNEKLKRLWTKYYHEQAEEIENGYEYVLQMEDS